MTTVWYLKNAEIFRGLSDTAIRRMESVAMIRRFRKGSSIYAPEDCGRCVLVLLEGRVKIKLLTLEGKEAILAFIDAGEIFGELSLVDPDRPYGEFAEAYSPCKVAAIERETFLDTISESANATFRLTKLIGLRRIRAENRVKGMLFRSSRERLETILADFAETYGRPTEHGTEIELKLSHQELAGLTGMSRETVTLTLGELKLEKVIRVSNRKITLLKQHSPMADPIPSTQIDLPIVARQSKGSVA